MMKKKEDEDEDGDGGGGGDGGRRRREGQHILLFHSFIWVCCKRVVGFSMKL